MSLDSKGQRAESSPFTGYPEPSRIGQETCQRPRPDSRPPAESESEPCSLPDGPDAGHPYPTIRTCPAIPTPCIGLVQAEQVDAHCLLHCSTMGSPVFRAL